jgi:Rod binding domain-containing protein
MELHRAQAPQPLPRIREAWPGPAEAAANRSAARDARIAEQFETLIARTLLQSARSAKLGDDGLSGGGLGSSGDNVRDMVDNARAEAIARAAPLGVARLLEAAPK